eukprot:9527978-Heterocapsa_arctica.AAC.1
MAFRTASSRGALRLLARASSTRWLCSPLIRAATSSGGHIAAPAARPPVRCTCWVCRPWHLWLRS